MLYHKHAFRLAGKYDFVHHRFLVFGFNPGEWTLALHKVYIVLSPGGRVQLLEITRWSGSPATHHFWDMVNDIVQTKGADVRISEKLLVTELLASTGFINLIVEDPPVSLHSASECSRKACEASISGFRPVNASVAKARGVDLDDLDHLLSAMARDSSGLGRRT